MDLGLSGKVAVITGASRGLGLATAQALVGEGCSVVMAARGQPVPATGFVPHCRLDAACAAETPVIVDHALDHQGPASVLVNLHPSPPPFFSRFERLAEIVSGDDAAAAAGRERWKFYRERGYELRSHDLSGRS